MHTTKGFTQEKNADWTVQNVETYLRHCPMTVYNIHLLAIISISVFFDVFSQQGDVRFPPPPHPHPPKKRERVRRFIFFNREKSICFCLFVQDSYVKEKRKQQPMFRLDAGGFLGAHRIISSSVILPYLERSQPCYHRAYFCTVNRTVVICTESGCLP